MTVLRLCPLLILASACGSRPSTEPLSPATANTAASTASVPSASAAPTVASVTPAPVAKPPSDAERAQAARDKADREHQAELARWTPEMHAAAKRLSEASYSSADAALKAVLASPSRRPGNAERDVYRHPRQTLEFFGFQPTSTVLEFGPGSGWYTELLAPALARRGKLVVTSSDPNGPPNDHGTLNAYSLRQLLGTSPELYGKVETALIDAKAPQLPSQDKFDLVLVIREFHDFVKNDNEDAWLSAFRSALKPHGVLGIVDHRALPTADPIQSAKLGYLPEAWVIKKVEAAGFKLTGKSDVNDNPKDTKDYPDGVWTLPPSFRLGAKDHDKYQAIGESDRFTLRFVKANLPGKTATKR